MSFRIEDILKDDHNKPEMVKVDNLQDRRTLVSEPLMEHRRRFYYDCCNNNYWKQSSAVLQRMHYYKGYFPDGFTRFPGCFSSFRPLIFYPQSSNTKRKGGQVRFSAKQTDALEKRFDGHRYLSPEQRKTLADALKLTDRQVKTWFQNRRAKWRRTNHSRKQ